MKWLNRTGNQCSRSGTSEVSRSLECSSPPKVFVECQTWTNDYYFFFELGKGGGTIPKKSDQNICDQTGTHAPKYKKTRVFIHPGLAVSPEIHGIMYDPGVLVSSGCSQHNMTTPFSNGA